MNLSQRSRQFVLLCLVVVALIFGAGCQADRASGSEGETTAVAEAPAQGDASTGAAPAETSPTPTPTSDTTPDDGAAPADPTAVPPTEAPTTEPTATPSPTLEPTATPSPTPEPTETPTPTAEPTATPEPSPTPIPDPDWLIYLNQLRDIAGLPHLVEDPILTTGSLAHAVYMVRTDQAAAHSEDRNSPHYSEAGARVAPRANIFSTTQIDGAYSWAMNFWMSGPFHVLQIIDPELTAVGYGQHNEDTGNIKMAAVLEVELGPRNQPLPETYPIYFPKNGGETWVIRKSMYEWPDPYVRCPGYSFQPPSGPVIGVQLGSGNVTPRVTGYRLLKGDTAVEVCAIDETTYQNPDAYAQQHGRTILGDRDAILLIPLKPLDTGQTYTAIIFANNETYQWSFTVVNRPPLKPE